MIMLTTAVALESLAFALVAMAIFILAFSASWAGGFWVVVSELFSMSTCSFLVRCGYDCVTYFAKAEVHGGDDLPQEPKPLQRRLRLPYCLQLEHLQT